MYARTCIHLGFGLQQTEMQSFSGISITSIGFNTICISIDETSVTQLNSTNKRISMVLPYMIVAMELTIQNKYRAPNNSHC